jgi:hypothetical protein
MHRDTLLAEGMAALGFVETVGRLFFLADCAFLVTIRWFGVCFQYDIIHRILLGFVGINFLVYFVDSNFLVYFVGINFLDYFVGINFLDYFVDMVLPIQYRHPGDLHTPFLSLFLVELIHKNGFRDYSIDYTIDMCGY